MLHFIAKRYGKDNTTQTILAGAIGAAAGIAIGAVAGAYLSDETNREKIQSKVGELNTKAKDTYFDVKHRILSHKDKANDKMKDKNIYAS